MVSRIDEVLIVGGGTAGWLTAGILAARLNSTREDAVKITLVESPNVPIMGVGEGTWPTMRTTLQTIGVDEGEFMRECEATFKQGSEFVNWLDSPESVGRHSYYHPLSAVFHSAHEFNLVPYWLLGEAEGRPYDEATASQVFACQQGLAPKKITTPAYDAILNYSYHLDAHKFAAFLTRHCTEKLGVKHVRANVTDVHLSEDGSIESVDTDHGEHSRLKADFFVDCSGSRALLLGGALDVPWKSVRDQVFNDTALAIQVPYDSESAPIATHTIATAHKQGWTWDIGLSSRRGVGFVYSSSHCSVDEAEQTLREYIGPSADNLEARKIGFDLGYREQFWKKNCVALGMSAAFIEPLEASAIFLIEAGANMLAEQFPRRKEAIPLVAKKYNSTFALRWHKTVDFIKLHYCISRRRDSDYWIDNCDESTVPDSLKERLEHWKYHPPGKFDFDYAYEPFVLDSYLFVLYGMQFATEIDYNKSAYVQSQSARRRFAEIQKLNQALQAELPSQRELVDKVYKYGFQRI
ncbi:tryptophan halogenase family protein [Microbulbifer elongatus]|uniref:tryptophan halogenase family protein n=1 Tax=Microbulbifer elongatus TaxID=86173 RepID=UPI001CFD9B20|nr:tryptophan halogenase family protein [Microbulbifer elongatus]